jgi:hypothetical protein
MSSEYPDVLGDLIEARQRFEVNGVHYVMALDPAVVAPSEVTRLRIWLQSCWDVPVQVVITVHLPTPPSPTFSGVEPSEYVVPLTIGAKFETRGLYIRSQENEGQLKDALLSFTTGMSLATSMGLGFEARTSPEQELTLRVEGQPRPGASPDLTPTYLSHWTVAELPFQGKARQQVNDQRLYLLPQLKREPLYMGFLDESRERFKDAALSLQIGEAIILAKILTYTVEHFLKRADWQDAILVPAYTLAHRYDLETGDPILLIVRADYARIVRLAISLSFGMLRQRLGREVWTMEEQLAVTDLVADRVERGGALPAEFLYLPLLLGGLMVNHEVQMPGENLAQSLDLFAKARQQRAADLAENPELNALLDRFLQMARSAS